MKKSFHVLACLSLILSLLLTSCVSSKKFRASEANVDKLQKDNANINSQLANTHSQLNESNAQVKNLNEGKEALKSLAMVLNNTNDITVMIEGHTDNVPIKTKLFEDNWDLSTARATSIVRILTKDYGFDSSRITASGKGQFHPVKTNETDEGRAGNRRTEVILSPDLKEIYKLLYQ